MKKFVVSLFAIFVLSGAMSILCYADVPFAPEEYYKNDTFEQYAGMEPLPEKLTQLANINPMYMSASLPNKNTITPVKTKGMTGEDTIAAKWRASSGTSNSYPYQSTNSNPVTSDIVVFQMKVKLTEARLSDTDTLGALYSTVTTKTSDTATNTLELVRISPKKVNLTTDSEEGAAEVTYRCDITFFYATGANMADRLQLNDAMDMDVWYDIKVVLDTTDTSAVKCLGAYINDTLVPGTKNRTITKPIDSLKQLDSWRIYSNNSNFEMYIDDIKMYRPLYQKYVINSVECGPTNEIKSGAVITGVNVSKYRSDGTQDTLYFGVYNEQGELCHIRAIEDIQDQFADNTTLEFGVPIEIDGTEGNAFTSKTFVWDANLQPVIQEFTFTKHIPTIYLAGDSTCQQVTEDRLPYAGWGMYLQQYFSGGVQVKNMAKGGYSMGMYIRDGFLDEIFSYANRGDYLFIQFGINDSNPQTTDKDGYADLTKYIANLKTFVDKAKENGVIPVIVTSTLIYSEVLQPDKSIVYPYREAAVQFAQDNGIAYIDIAKANHALVTEWNTYPDGFTEGSQSEGGKQLFWWTPAGTNPAGAVAGRFDGVHLSLYGADEIAKIIVNQIDKSENENLKNLASFIDREKDITQGDPLAEYPW